MSTCDLIERESSAIRDESDAVEGREGLSIDLPVFSGDTSRRLGPGGEPNA
jgi:hypothetical protein